MTKKGFSIQKDKLEGLWKAKRAGCVFLRIKKVLQRWDGCPLPLPFASTAAQRVDAKKRRRDDVSWRRFHVFRRRLVMLGFTSLDFARLFVVETITEFLHRTFLIELFLQFAKSSFDGFAFAALDF
jgi:hypothetical protein